MTMWCINNNLYAEKLEATGLQQDMTSLRAATCEPSNILPKRNLILYNRVLKYTDLYLPMIVCLNPVGFCRIPLGPAFCISKNQPINP